MSTPNAVPAVPEVKFKAPTRLFQVRYSNERITNRISIFRHSGPLEKAKERAVEVLSRHNWQVHAVVPYEIDLDYMERCLEDE